MYSIIRHAIAVHDWGRIVAGLADSASFWSFVAKDEPVDGWFRKNQSVMQPRRVERTVSSHSVKSKKYKMHLRIKNNHKNVKYKIPYQ